MSSFILFSICEIYCTLSDIIHSLNSFYLIFRFELLRYALALCHLFYQPKKHILCLLVKLGKIAVHLSTCQQIMIQDFCGVVSTAYLCLGLIPFWCCHDSEPVSCPAKSSISDKYATDLCFLTRHI